MNAAQNHQTSVFISHSSKDYVAAQSVCNFLESRGLNCWISSRDLRPGAEYAEQIVEAFNQIDSVVLLLSSHSNSSVHVKNEIERAVSSGKLLLPVRIEEVEPSKSLEFFVMAQQWIDAYMPPLNDRLARLEEAIHSLRKIDIKSSQAPTDRATRDSGRSNTNGIITGNRVCIRRGPTVVARQVAMLNQGDEVDIIEQLVIDDSDEYQLKDNYLFEPEVGKAYMLTAGRGFVASGESDSNYRVEITSPHGTDVGYVPKELLIPLNRQSWYKIRAEESEGWILGRYVRAF